MHIQTYIERVGGRGRYFYEKNVGTRKLVRADCLDGHTTQTKVTDGEYPALPLVSDVSASWLDGRGRRVEELEEEGGGIVVWVAAPDLL